MNRSAAVLRNRGVCIEVNETVQVDGVWEVARDAEGTAKLTTAWVRMDGNSLADLEEAWGDLTNYQIATGSNPYRTIRRTLAIVFGWDDLHSPEDKSGRLCSGCRRAGLAMAEGKLNSYTTAVGAAISLANGLDPTKVVEMIRVGVKANAELVAARDAALEEMLAAEPDPAESTSTDGSTDGSELAAATTSSGG